MYHVVSIFLFHYALDAIMYLLGVSIVYVRIMVLEYYKCWAFLLLGHYRCLFLYMLFYCNVFIFFC